MSAFTALVDDLAGQLEAMASTLRRHAQAEGEEEWVEARLTEGPTDPIERARSIHPALGERQEQILRLVADAHSGGITAGDISRALEYDQANTYLTLEALAKHGLVRRDDTVRPYRFYLGRKMLT
jgi:DNA-binding transcriptional ArsR family regulator